MRFSPHHFNRVLNRSCKEQLEATFYGNNVPVKNQPEWRGGKRLAVSFGHRVRGNGVPSKSNLCLKRENCVTVHVLLRSLDWSDDNELVVLG